MKLASPSPTLPAGRPGRVASAFGLAAALLSLSPAPAGAQAPPAAGAGPPPAQFRLSGSWRLREEFWNWFDGGSEGSYAFTGSILRLRGDYDTRQNRLVLELAQPGLFGLPKDAVLPPPQGQLGFGGAYRDANGAQEASLFIKQATWTAKRLGNPQTSATLGRFEFIDGLETVPKEPALAWLKRERIAHRVFGNFGWSHVGRSIDGGQLVYKRPGMNLTLMGGMPTEGSFDLDGGATLAGVKVGYAAATFPWTGDRGRGEARAFGVYYRDDRDGVVKADNRPAPVRVADTNAVGIATLGGHAIGVWDLAGGRADGLLWAVGQFGDFGLLEHRSFAVAAEAGFRPRGAPWDAWLRAGYFHASGDGDPGDGRHETYFPVLPTPRVYARFPFFTMANLNDAFVQAVLRPEPRWTIRADAHALWLAEPDDLWYVGGGAFQDEPSFGYGGRPSGGRRGLATLLDVSADYSLRSDTTLSLYLGYAFGGDVVRRIYGGAGNSADGLLGYLELTRRF